jgi:SAM-dependent methyltransferase
MGEDFLWFSSLPSERYYYCAEKVQGYCLDVGCGPNNRFVSDFLSGNGTGIDVFPYEGLSKNQVFPDLTKFPFDNEVFETVTFIASINHVPKNERSIELAEAYRCLKTGGNILVTMGNPLAEILTHQVAHLSDKFFKTNFDLDGQRGMGEDEDYYLTKKEIINLLEGAGFKNIQIRYFTSQWWLNSVFIGEKE